MHIPVSARDGVALGLVELPGLALVDAWGWIQVEERPNITTWVRVNGKAHLLGKLPYSSASLQLQQFRSDDGHAIITKGTHDLFRVEIFHWPAMYENSAVWVMVSRIVAKRDIEAELALVLQPLGRSGIQPIFHLNRTGQGAWFADGTPLLTVSKPGSMFISSTWKDVSLWEKFCAGDHHERLEPVSINCGAGLAEAAEVYYGQLKEGQELSTFSILPRKPVTSLRRLSEQSLWRGSIADRKGLLNAGSYIDIGKHQWLLEAARHRVLIDKGPLSLGRCLGVVVLARLGFVRIAAERLGNWLKKESWSSNNAAFLGWSATEFLIWTQERSWFNAHEGAIRKLLDELVEQKQIASGQEIFGRDGSKRWYEIWRTAALLNAVHAVGKKSQDRHRWGLAGAKARADLLFLLGTAPWSAHRDRAPDGSSAALLAAGWLGLVPLHDPALQKTLEFVKKRSHMDGVLLHGGAHLAVSAILFAIQQRMEVRFSGVNMMAAMASKTGALPKIIHRDRGALESGDDPFSAALFLMLALDNILIKDHEIHIGSDIVSLKNMPTPFGRIDVAHKKATGRWNHYSVPVFFRH